MKASRDSGNRSATCLSLIFSCKVARLLDSALRRRDSFSDNVGVKAAGDAATPTKSKTVVVAKLAKNRHTRLTIQRRKRAQVDKNVTSAGPGNLACPDEEVEQCRKGCSDIPDHSSKQSSVGSTGIRADNPPENLPAFRGGIPGHQ